MATQNGTEASILPLPTGGGATRSIDEAFQTNLNTGGGFYQIPIRLPKGVDDHQPNLVLAYATGQGNGPFGLGWDIRVPSIRVNPDLRHRGGEPMFLFEARQLAPVGGAQYRPVAEAEFSRITRLPDGDGWEVRAKTGQVLRFGTSPSSRSGDGTRTREWHLDEIRDINGNVITFTWEVDGNRAYLSRVAYAVYEVRLSYEERDDAFSSFRDGYEVVTGRRCTEISVHLTTPDPRPFKTYRLGYSAAPYSRVSLLTKVQFIAQRQDDAGGPITEHAMPPVTLDYTPFDPTSARLEVLDQGTDLPPPLTRSDTTLLDFEGTGLPGVVQMAGGDARFWANRGAAGWAAPRRLGNLPPGVDLASGTLVLADVEGNGTADLIDAAAQTNGYYPAEPGGTWGRKVSYRESPTTALASRDARLIDLDGDGRVDLLKFDGQRAFHYFNDGAEGWDRAPVVAPRADFPPVDLSDPHVRLADMAGDGRTHLVSVHDRRVVWYPNLGQGRWGAARRMSDAPELPRNYDPGRLFLADVDGSGAADIVYVDFDRVTVWINQSGRGFSAPVTIPGTPPMAAAAILVADMKGRGTRGIVWSYPAALRGRDAYRYLDMAGGTKPYLLSRIVNDRSVETRLIYGSSTDWPRDLDDPDIEQAGFLPFPVPVVARLEVTDPARGQTSISTYEYRNGHFDGAARTFMGFGRGTQRDLGDDTIPTLATVSYFHTREPKLMGLNFLSRTFGEDGSPNAHRPYREEETRFELVEHDQAEDGQPICHVRRNESVSRAIERSASATERRIAETYDDFGNVTESRETATWDDDGAPRVNVKVTSLTFTRNETHWLVGLPVRETVRDGDGRVLSAVVRYYDGPDFEGLPEGEATKGNLTRESRLAMLPEHDIFGFGVPAMEAAGYKRRDDPELGDGWWIDSVSQRRDARGLLAERRNAVGTPTLIEFDEHGISPARIEFANGSAITADYDLRYGGVTRFTDANDVPKVFAYDIAGRLASVNRFDDPPGQPFMVHEYDEEAVPASTVTLTRSEPGAAQHRRVEYFDGLGETLQTRSEAADGQVVVSGRKALNVRGLRSEEFEPYFGTGLGFRTDDQTATDKTVRLTYDATGRSVTRTDWDGNVFTSEFALGWTVRSDPFDLDTSAGNDKADTPATVHHDPLERVTLIREEHEAGAYETRYRYDAAGQRTGVEINGDAFATNSFDCLGRRIRSVYRDAGAWSFFHDAAGNVVERTDGKGERVHRTYDGLGRITELRHGGAGGTVEESYRYDAGEPGETHTIGKLTQVSGAFGAVRFAYGPCGCLQSKTREFPGLAVPQTITYITDSLDRYLSVIYPDGFAQDMLYDAGGLLRAVPGIVDRIEYTPTGRKALVEYASGVVTRYTYEPGSQRLLRVVTTAPDGSTTYADATYSYGALGSVEEVTDAATVPGHVANTRRFRHDGLSQILEETGIDSGGAHTHGYAYDENLNLTSYPERFGSDAILHDDPAHPYRVTGRGAGAAAGYAYDDAGNITESPTCRFTFDARNRLTRVQHENGTEVTYLYDHVGVRVVTRVTVGAVTDTEFNFDDVFVISGATRTRVVFDHEGAIGLVRSDGVRAVFHRDDLGSHVAASDMATGVLLGRVTYRAFGQIATSTGGIPGPFRYNGKKYSEVTDLVFYGSRYYLPELGRFLTPDPLFLDQQPDMFFQQPRSLALYAYVLNNPMNMVDPYGNFAFLVGLAIVAAVGFAVGVGAYSINQAVSGGSWQLSEAIMAGIMGAVTIGLTFALLGPVAAIVVGGAMLAKPALTGALDKASMGDDFGSRFLGFLSFAIKFASSPITSTIGLLIGGFGTGFGLWGDVEWFKGGVIAFEYDSKASGFSAVTLGATVNIWTGNTDHHLFKHELYHSRQYTYFGDAFIPFWLLGGVYGLISSAAAGEFQWDCFNSGNPTRGYGNPLEDGAHAAARGGGCT